ncbi:MAG: hypothetical protein HY289_02710 [Planctomycetes bacterium]|nr:hypothetical protein [Planctomycetota bacterium]
MTKIDLTKRSPTLPQVLQLAGEEDLILETLEGRQFVVAEIDDFADEVAAVVKNKALMQLLAERSKETKRVSLAEARARLGLKKKPAGKACIAKRR